MRHSLFVRNGREKGGDSVLGVPNFIYTKAQAAMQEDGPPPGVNPHPQPSHCLFGERENTVL